MPDTGFINNRDFSPDERVRVRRIVYRDHIFHKLADDWEYYLERKRRLKEDTKSFLVWGAVLATVASMLQYLFGIWDWLGGLIFGGPIG